MTDNPYLGCEAVNMNGRWHVRSKYWSFEAGSKIGAERAVGIIQCAYRCGRGDVANTLKAIIAEASDD